MTAAAPFHRLGPLLLHVLTGTAVVALMLQVPCGSDECLGPLFAGVSAGVWAVTAPLVVVAARARARGPRALAWGIWLFCLPLSWASALGLFLLHPALGNA